MAGYIFTIDDINSIEESIYDGVYSTVIRIPKNKIWGKHHEGTFADYITMQEGDNVYFFHQRKIYGIGELININGDCKFLNFPDSDLPYTFIFKGIKEDMIIDKTEMMSINGWFAYSREAPISSKTALTWMKSFPLILQNSRC